MPKVYFCQTLKRNYFSLGYESNVSKLHENAVQLAGQIRKTINSIKFREIKGSNHMDGFIVIFSTDGAEEQPIEGAMQVKDAWNYFN